MGHHSQRSVSKAQRWQAPKLLLNSMKNRCDFVKKLLVLLAIAGACFAYWYLHRPITYEPGVLIGADPTQVNLPRDEPEFGFGDFHLKPLARFTLDARLLHSRVYRFDPGARLVPIDLAVGWGPMSDQRVLDRLHITQS